MGNTRFASLLMILVVGGVSACQDDPAVVPDPDASSSFAISTTNATGMGPFLLELPREEGEPSLRGCAQAVNDEGFIAGWHVIDLWWASAIINAATVWDRQGKPLPWSPWHNGDQDLLVLDMNNRGQVLVRGNWWVADEVTVFGPDGHSEHPIQPGYYEHLKDNPIRMNRTGSVMATFQLDSEFCRFDPCPAFSWIAVTGRGKLTPPEDPSRQPPGFLPEADCEGEAIDDNGAVFGRCYGAESAHYRWVTGNDPTPFPAGADDLADVWIHDVNRYGELLGKNSAGAIYWSPSTGRIQIPLPPGVSRLEPVAINDRGVVLLASDYNERDIIPARTVAWWTRSGSTKVVPRNGWPIMAAFDINNQGVIVGCVGGDGEKELVPAYWRTQ
jgi:hypothetical protein